MYSMRTRLIVSKQIYREVVRVILDAGLNGTGLLLFRLIEFEGAVFFIFLKLYILNRFIDTLKEYFYQQTRNMAKNIK